MLHASASCPRARNTAWGSAFGFGAIYAADVQRVTMDHPAITKERANEVLRWDVNIAYRAVGRLTQPYTEDLNRNQKSALATTNGPVS